MTVPVQPLPGTIPVYVVTYRPESMPAPFTDRLGAALRSATASASTVAPAWAASGSGAAPPPLPPLPQPTTAREHAPRAPAVATANKRRCPLTIHVLPQASVIGADCRRTGCFWWVIWRTVVELSNSLPAGRLGGWDGGAG